MKNYRPLASQASSFRLYGDNYEEVMEICRMSERKPAEELRDLIDEALRARRASSGQARPEMQAPEPNSEGVDGRLQQLIEQNEEFKQNLREMVDHSRVESQTLTRELREYYGLLLEVLAGSYGARRLVWKYVAETALRQSGCAPEQIKAQFEAEAKAWNAERDKIADTLEQAIRSLPPPQGSSNS